MSTLSALSGEIQVSSKASEGEPLARVFIGSKPVLLLRSDGAIPELCGSRRGLVVIKLLSVYQVVAVLPSDTATRSEIMEGLQRVQTNQMSESELYAMLDEWLPTYKLSSV